MKVKNLKDLLSKFNDEQEVVVLDSNRIGHDDAVLYFDIVGGFGSNEEIYDVRLKKGSEEYDDEEDKIDFIHPCCVIRI